MSDSEPRPRPGRAAALAAALVAALGPAAAGARAQSALAVTAGARYATNLVDDTIVQPFSVRQAVAPFVAARFSTPLTAPWTLDVRADLATSEADRRDADGTVTGIARTTTLVLDLGVERPLEPWLTGRIGVGVIKYFAAAQGMFRSGVPLKVLGSLALDVAPPFAARRGLALEARYDVHPFTTPALENEGFSGARAVHRLSLGVRATLWRHS